jgi:hypothetical protein
VPIHSVPTRDQSFHRLLLGSKSRCLGFHGIGGSFAVGNLSSGEHSSEVVIARLIDAGSEGYNILNVDSDPTDHRLPEER